MHSPDLTLELQSLKEKFNRVRAYSNYLTENLNEEDFSVQAVYYASPVKWHLAHTTWFFEEMILSKEVENYERFDKDFAYLFNSYYNTVGKRTLRAERGNITRPSIHQVFEYRAFVDEKMNEFLDSSDLEKDIADLIELGLNHEQQHQELLLTDLKYVFGHNPIFPVYHKDFNLISDHNKEEGLVTIDAGLYEVGFKGKGFCYDNELNRHKVYLESFEIQKSLVTNGEYLEFMNSGGYQDFRYWLDEGWTWIQENKINAPLHWHFIDGEWYYYTLSGLKPVDRDAILSHVSYYEANAFAQWKGLRLPTEFEWEIASKELKWGQRWEWTNSAYLPYPGFRISDGAVGEYNGKFMVNQMVLRGASNATSENHSRPSYRNFFHPHFQWQVSGIRLIKA